MFRCFRQGFIAIAEQIAAPDFDAVSWKGAGGGLIGPRVRTENTLAPDRHSDLRTSPSANVCLSYRRRFFSSQPSNSEPPRNVAEVAGSGALASTSRAPGVLPDGENQVAALSVEIAWSEVSPVLLRFHAAASVRPALTATQYRLPCKNWGWSREFKTRGG